MIGSRNPDEIALVEAVRNGDIEPVESLISRGVDINLTDNGEPLIVLAALYGRSEVVKILREAGATITVRAAACLGDNRRLAELLSAATEEDWIFVVEGHKCPESTVDSSALVLAAGQGHTETVRLLLARGADVDSANIFGETALIMAVQRGDTRTVRALMEGGAAINLIPYNGEAALLHAPNVQMVRLLIDYGADVNRGGSDFNIFCHSTITPLIACVYRQDLASMRLLLERGAQVNGRDGEGCTALMKAAAVGWLDGVELLLAAGADVTMRNEQGWSALTWTQYITNVAVMVDMRERLEQVGAQE